MTPSTISLITTTPMAAHHRTRALGLWSAAAAIGGAAGLVIGGVLTSALGWRYVLFINVPLGAALLLAAAVSLLPATARSDWRRLGIPGAVTVTAGAVALVYGLSDASASGWGSTGVIASLAAAWDFWRRSWSSRPAPLRRWSPWASFATGHSASPTPCSPLWE